MTTTHDLLTLQVWLSPAFPVGAFTYSHGLEWAIEAGDVASAAALEAWLADVLVHGAGRSDAIFLTHAHAATVAGEVERLAEIVELASAFQPSKERRLEASAQGAAFVRAVADTWDDGRFAAVAAQLDAHFSHLGLGETPWTHAVAVGVAAAVGGIGRDALVPAFLQAFAANVISAGVRAVPLGQSDGLRILRRLGTVVRRIADEAISADLDGVGGATLVADVASMKHETQYTRLFRS